MRRFPLVRVLIVALLLAFVPQIASAQSVSTSSPPPIRDAQAIAVLQSAILGMGGTQSIAAIQDSTIEGTQQNPTNPQAAPLTFTWQQSGAEFRDFIQATDHTYTSLSGHGNPGGWRTLRRGTGVNPCTIETRGGAESFLRFMRKRFGF
jgi:hypothetical protein